MLAVGRCGRMGFLESLGHAGAYIHLANYILIHNDKSRRSRQRQPWGHDQAAQQRHRLSARLVSVDVSGTLLSASGQQSEHSPQDTRSGPSRPIAGQRQKARSAARRGDPRRSPTRPATWRPRRPDLWLGRLTCGFAGRVAHLTAPGPRAADDGVPVRPGAVFCCPATGGRGPRRCRTRPADG